MYICSQCWISDILPLTVSFLPLFSRNQACVSARIFACYAIVHSHGNRNIGNDSVESMRVKPLLPLLTSLVNVEMTALDERDVVTSRILKEKKRVHFSGFDCSATKPPVEAKVGSHEHQKDCISEMIAVSEQIRSLIIKYRVADMESDESSLVVRAVKSLLIFLDKMARDTHLKRECALVSNAVCPLYLANHGTLRHSPRLVNHCNSLFGQVILQLDLRRH